MHKTLGNFIHYKEKWPSSKNEYYISLEDAARMLPSVALRQTMGKQMDIYRLLVVRVDALGVTHAFLVVHGRGVDGAMQGADCKRIALHHLGLQRLFLLIVRRAKRVKKKTIR